MNLVLVRADELDPSDRIRLADRRAQHLASVLRVGPGDRVRLGVVDGLRGHAVVEEIDASGGSPVIHLRFDRERAVTPPRPRDVLVLAVPRPRVLRRCLAAAAALGYGRIVLLRTWQVDRSHLTSKQMEPGAVDDALLTGLEQGCRTHLPTVVRCDAFRPFIEDRLEGILAPEDGPPPVRYVGHPDPGRRSDAAPQAPAGRPPFALAIGPERGFVPHEIERLVEHGFRRIACGEAPLTVENALCALSGHLRFLHPEETGGADPDGNPANGSRARG